MTRREIKSMGWEYDMKDTHSSGVETYYMHVGAENYRLTHSEKYSMIVHKQSVSESTTLFQGYIIDSNHLIQVMRDVGILPMPKPRQTLKAFNKTRY